MIHCNLISLTLLHLTYGVGWVSLCGPYTNIAGESLREVRPLCS